MKSAAHFARFAAIFLTCVTIFPLQTWSQDEGDSNFYPHNFAQVPVDLTPGAAPKDAPPATNATVGTEESAAISSAEADNSLFENQEEKGTPISSISVILDGLDLPTIQSSVEIMLSIYNSKGVRPSSVYLIGRSADRISNELRFLQRRLAWLGVGMGVQDAPPENFKVKKVPSWIVTTTEGDIVLEGLTSPEKYINKKGEFVEPKPEQTDK